MIAFFAGALATLVVVELVHSGHLTRLTPRRIAQAVARRRFLRTELRRMYVTLRATVNEHSAYPAEIPEPVLRRSAASLPRALRKPVRRWLVDYVTTTPGYADEWPWAPIPRDTTGKTPR